MAINNATVVLVHGRWADGSNWAKVMMALASGVKAVAAAPAADLIPRRRRRSTGARAGQGAGRAPGHAYAGGVIGATRSEKVKALVYVAALAPDQGETVADVSLAARRIGTRPSSLGTRTVRCIRPKRPSPPPSRKCIRRKSWPCWRRSSGRLARLHHRQDGVAFVERSGRPGPSSPSRTLVVTENHRFMAERIRAHVRSICVDHALVTAPTVYWTAP